jgi:hypothetical protein
LNIQIIGNIIVNNDFGIFGDSFPSAIHEIKGEKSIMKNLIAQCDIHGFYYTTTLDNTSFENNTLIYNKNGTLLEGTDKLYMKNNNFLYSINYDVINKHGKWLDWDFTNNWWGTTNFSEINESIYDYYDDFNLGKVIYKPFLTSLSPDAPKPDLVNITIPDVSDIEGPSTNGPDQKETKDNDANKTEPDNGGANGDETDNGKSNATDSDGDGYSNSAESTAGSDPYDSRSTPLDLDGDGVTNEKDAYPNDADKWEKEGGTDLVFIIFILVVIIISFSMGYFSYSRINRSNVLAHETRLTIIEYIRNHPGEHLGGLSKELNINQSTLRHHLRSLQDAGQIKIRKDNKYSYIYPAGTTDPLTLTPITVV